MDGNSDSDDESVVSLPPPVCTRSVCSTDIMQCTCHVCREKAGNVLETVGDVAPVCEDILPGRAGERKRQAFNKAVLEARTRRRVILDDTQASTPAQKILAKHLARVRELKAAKEVQERSAQGLAEQRTTMHSDQDTMCARCGHYGSSIECCTGA